MKSREQREQELISSGLVDAIKSQYKNINYNIPDKYFILIADYIDSIDQLDKENDLYLNSIEVAKQLPQVLNSIVETDLGGVYGRTDGNRILMNARCDYETNKLFFFHELTHALQTRKENAVEQCSFYDGRTGMFLAEGATQFTAEILYNASNGCNMHYRDQNSVRGQAHHTTYSPLSEYQLNGNILLLLSASLGVPLNHLLALGYKKNGRQLIKNLYEAFPGKAEKFEEFMLDLEKIYSIDKLVIAGKINEINKEPRNIIINDRMQFVGNMQIQDELINKVERELAANFIANNEPDYIRANYQRIYMYLTTPQLKKNFENVVKEIINMSNYQNNLEESNGIKM